MGKWIAALGLIILIVLVLLWRELDTSSAAQPSPAAPAPVAQVVPTAPAAVTAAAAPAAAPAAVTPVKADPAKEKMDPQSDEFFYYHDEIVIPTMMKSAVKCWENLPPAKRAEFHRNQSMTAKFKQRIRDGVVSIVELEVERSTISDPALQACFVQQLRGVTWSNARLPDWDQEDQIKLGPRTLKKYTRENIEFETPEFTGP